MVGLISNIPEIYFANIFSELSIAPEKNGRLVPPHARKELLSRGIDLEAFVPMSKEEMVAHLD